MEAIKGAALTLLLTLLTGASLAAATLRVGPGRTYATVGRALQQARRGDVVEVYGGPIYRERLTISQPVTLRGIGLPVIDGGRRSNVIEVKADRVTIEGIKVVGSARSSMTDYCGIHARQVRGLRIRGNVLRDNQFSIMLQDCEHSEITGNNIASDITYNPIMGNAVHCWKCTDMRIHGNIIGHNRDGIYLEFVDHSYIYNNRVSGCARYGMHFMFSHHNTYQDNRFVNNKAGVAVMYTHHVKMVNNLFAHNQGTSCYGLLIKELQYSTIRGNQFVDNTVGLMVDGGSDIKAAGNVFSANGWGVRLVSGSSNDTLTHNNFVGNTFDMTTNKSYNGNAVDGNYWDKYEGYDLNHDGRGDVPFYPLSLFSMLAEQNPSMLLFFRSFMMTLLDEAEKILPTLTPDTYVDRQPAMHPYSI